MSKTLKNIEKTAIKRTYKTILPLVKEMGEIQSKIEEYRERIEEISRQIEDWDKPIMNMTGFSCLDLCKETKIDTGKFTDKGKPIISTKIEFKYETIIPEEEVVSDLNGQEEVLEEKVEMKEVSSAESPITSTIANLDN